MATSFEGLSVLMGLPPTSTVAQLRHALRSVAKQGSLSTVTTILAVRALKPYPLARWLVSGHTSPISRELIWAKYVTPPCVCPCPSDFRGTRWARLTARFCGNSLGGAQ